MTKAELSQALAMARNKHCELPGYFDTELSIFDNYGLPGFEPITCTLRLLAGLVRGQCTMMDGEIDPKELNEIARFGRRLFTVV